jgi:DNA ligase-associated metallophosphoesterase
MASLGFGLSFGGQEFLALGDGALLWPRLDALIVADLHLEKASWYARAGQMLPPYDSQATLDRLERLVDRHGVRTLWVLGDSFHDVDGPGRLPEALAQRIAALAARCRLVWIAGNHDEASPAMLGGEVADEITVEGLVLRHCADLRETRPELSGHFHPKWRVTARSRSVSRRCFVMGRSRLILPAFGALAGGLHAGAREIQSLAGRPAEALVPVRGALLRFPLG